MANRTLARMWIPLTVAVFLPCTDAAAEDFPAILDRASAYVAEFEAQFAAIIWHETYEQVDRLPLRFGSTGGRFTRVGRRLLESEMLFISVDANATRLTVRDVISVARQDRTAPSPGVAG